MTRLLLLRHASHDVVTRILCGRGAGVNLGSPGRAEAAALARRVRREGPVALFTSPQPRAWQTAEPIAEACGLAPEARAELDEIDFGDWTGRSFASLQGDPCWAAWNLHRATARPPRGEAMFEVQARLLRWLESLPARHGDATLVAVSHADVIKAALVAHLGLSLDAHDRFEIAPASLSILTLWPGGGRVRSINEVLPSAEEQACPPP
jgi:broad specificity phosphatase PhoE